MTAVTPPAATSARRGSLLARRRIGARPRGGPVLVIASTILVVIAVLGIIGPLIAPESPLKQSFADGAFLPPFTDGHLLGTDQLARDILSRALYGTRTSLTVAAAAVALSTIVGGALGLIAGYVGGSVEAATMRLMDALLAFPALVLALLIAVSLGPSLRNTILAIGIVGVPSMARLVRAQTQRVVRLDYVTSARVLGASPLRILAVHVIPNISRPVAALMVLVLGYAIPAEASLSFLGLGVQPPTASWGNMIADGYADLGHSPWVLLVPTVLVMLTVTSASLVSDELFSRMDEA